MIRPYSAGAEVRHTGTGQTEGPPGVNAEHSAPVVVSELPQHSVTEDPCVVDEHVDPTRTVNNLCDGRFNRRRVADIDPESAPTHLGCGRLDRLWVEVHEGDVGAGLGEMTGEFEADAACSAGDDDRLSGVVKGDVSAHASRSNTIAMPCPPPTHIVSTPNCLSWN